MASSSNSPCAACKFLRRKCTQECTFAPYFPPDQPLKFSNVHKVFGASNVAKLLNELAPSQREDAVNSLAYEANARLQDPVYGCVGMISLLQQQLKQVQNDLLNARKELSAYIGPSAMLPLTHQHQHPHHHHHHHLLQQNPGGLMANAMGPFGMSPLGAASHHQSQLLLREHQQHQQMLEAQQLAVVVAAREQQDMLRSYEQQQQQHQELVRFNSGFDGGSVGGGVGSDGGPFNQISSGTPSPLALVPFDNPFQLPQPHHQDHQHHHHQLQQQQQQQQQQQEERAAGSDEESKDNISTFHVVGTSS